MSEKSIIVSRINTRTSKSDLQKKFRYFGKITECELEDNKGTKQKNAIITFEDHNSTQRAIENNLTIFHENIIRVELSQKTMNKYNHIIEILKDASVVLVVAIISMALHLYKLDTPNVVIFDETHFGQFINGYITGERFFDIHPPLAKIIMAMYAKHVCHYDGKFKFEVDDIFPEGLAYKLRLLPAMCGSLIPPVIAAGLILGFHSRTVSLLAGILLCTDCNLIAQCRLFVTDGIVYLFVALTIFMTCLLPRWHCWTVVFLQGLFGACAAASKFAAGSVLVLVALSNMRLTLKKRGGIIILGLSGILCFAILFTMLYFTMYYHLKLTPIVGYGDQYMEKAFRKYDTTKQIIVMYKAMYRYNRDLSFTHPYQSKWYEWPFANAIPTVIWYDLPNKMIALFNNPVSSSMALFGAIFAFIFRYYDYALTFAASFLPFALVSRCTWSYHYEVSLIVGVVCLAISLDWIPKKARILLSIAIMVAAIYCLYFWYPIVYGTCLPDNVLLKKLVWPKLLKSFA